MECDWTAEALGAGAALWPEGAGFAGLVLPGLAAEEQVRLEAHLANCPACGAFALELRHLDSLLGSEPVPTPPADLSASILQEVAARRRAELAWGRGRSLVVALVLVLVAIAAASSGALGSGVEAWTASDWDLSLQAWNQVQGGLAGLRSSFDGLIQSAAPATGFGSEGGLWPLFLALGPGLLVLNWALGRGALQGKVSS